MNFIYSVFNYYIILFNLFVLRLKNPHSSFEPHVIIKGPLSNIKLGNNINIQSSTVLHLGGKNWCNHTGWIEIGDNSTISPNCVLYGCGSEIKVGRNFDCGPFVGIYASRTDYINKNAHIFKPVNIGDNVIIFSHVVINPGVSIGDGAVIAAGSVVINDIPANVLAGGTPAKVIKDLSNYTHNN